MSSTGAKSSSDDQLERRNRLLYEALVAHLRREGWEIASEDEEERAFAAPVQGENGRWICLGQMGARGCVLRFWSVLPTFVPPNRRSAVGEYLHRANCGLISGGFQYNLDEGEVRYLTTLDFGDGDPEILDGSDLLSSALGALVDINLATTDRYLPGLLSVLGGSDPAAEIAKIDL